MYILTIKAFADFDIPYTVNLGAFNSYFRVNYLKDSLNEWVNKHPKVNSDIRILNILEDSELKKEFVDTFKCALLSAVPQNEIDSFVEICLKVFTENYVYLNTGIFDVEELKVIC